MDSVIPPRGVPLVLWRLQDALAAAAQRVYADWDQSGEDGDPDLGFGGICQDVAAAMADVLQVAGITATSAAAACGDQHVFVVARILGPGPNHGVWRVDIPPQVYETGAGYAWRKKDGVTIAAAALVFDCLDPDPTRFALYCEDGWDAEIGADEPEQLCLAL